MDEREPVTKAFEDNRAHLEAVAVRMLGSVSDAQDAVQEAWLRLRRVDAGDVGNVRGWLTTVVARVCLDALRARRSRRDATGIEPAPDPVAPPHDAPDHEVLLGDSIGLALLAVLDTLSPAERVAFVLHDMFDLPFEEIAPMVGRSPAAARQLASRARRRVRGAEPNESDAARARHLVAAFLAAARTHDLSALLALLDTEAVFRADAAASALGAEPSIRGAAGVADSFMRRTLAARLVLADGEPAAVWAPDGRPRSLFSFTLRDDKIAAIDLEASPERLGDVEIVFLEP